MDAIENAQGVIGLCTRLTLRYHILDSLTVWRPTRPDTFVGRLVVSCNRAAINATSLDLTHLSILLQSIFIPLIGINIPLWNVNMEGHSWQLSASVISRGIFTYILEIQINVTNCRKL